MTDFFNRLDKYMSYSGLNENKLTIEVNISNGLIGKARKRGALSQDNISKILHCYDDLDANWLFTGEGQMLKQQNYNLKEAKDVYQLKSDRLVDEQFIPLYNLEASAGLVELFQNHNDLKPIDTIHIPNLPKCDGAVFITGDSMYPLLKSGDIVAYKQITDFENDIFWGEMYLISIEIAGEEYISVKYIQKSEKGDQYIKLVSKNEHHQSKDVKINKVRAMALIKASIRINSMG